MKTDPSGRPIPFFYFIAEHPNNKSLKNMGGPARDNDHYVEFHVKDTAISPTQTMSKSDFDYTLKELIRTENMNRESVSSSPTKVSLAFLGYAIRKSDGGREYIVYSDVYVHPEFHRFAYIHPGVNPFIERDNHKFFNVEDFILHIGFDHSDMIKDASSNIYKVNNNWATALPF